MLRPEKQFIKTTFNQFYSENNNNVENNAFNYIINKLERRIVYLCIYLGFNIQL